VSSRILSPTVPFTNSSISSLFGSFHSLVATIENLFHACDIVVHIVLYADPNLSHSLPQHDARAHGGIRTLHPMFATIETAPNSDSAMHPQSRPQSVIQRRNMRLFYARFSIGQLSLTAACLKESAWMYLDLNMVQNLNGPRGYRKTSSHTLQVLLK